MHEDKNKNQTSMENFPRYVKLTHQLSFRNLNLKLNHHTRVVHQQPQTPQGESVAKPETLLLIILSIICKYDIKEVHGN